MLNILLNDILPIATLCVVAHCDDETLMSGGLLARLSERGDTQVMAFCAAEPVRRAEFMLACSLLGCDPLPLDYSDEMLGEQHFQECTRAILEEIRRVRPSLVITHDPEYDYNPEHRFIARCAVHAAQKAGMSDEGWRPSLVISGEVHNPLPFPDYMVDVSAEMTLMERALAAHNSQLTAGHKHGYYADLLRARCRWRGVQAGCDAAMAFRRLPLPVIGNLYAQSTTL